MTILVGIDGTGTMPTGQYLREFRGSFVHHIYTVSGARKKHYHRGPSATLLDLQMGTDTLPYVEEGYEYIHMFREPDEAVLLTGYSRGAAAVVAVAQRLQQDRVRVAGMMLFDCVDRCPLIDTEVIPSNVDEVIHVSRDDRSMSRESFGHSGTRANPPTIYNGRPQGHTVISDPMGRQWAFRGTHGAMGGVPWHREGLRGAARGGQYIDEGFPDDLTTITYERDLECSTEIWNAVRADLQRLGFIPG